MQVLDLIWKVEVDLLGGVDIFLRIELTVIEAPGRKVPGVNYDSPTRGYQRRWVQLCLLFLEQRQQRTTQIKLGSNLRLLKISRQNLGLANEPLAICKPTNLFHDKSKDFLVSEIRILENRMVV